MKQKLLLLFAVLAMAVSASAATFAYDFQATNSSYQNVYYKIISAEDKTCEVTCQYDNSNNQYAYNGNLIIPTTATNSNNGVKYTVIKIGDRAFQYCSGLTSVTFANTITSIGENAFNGCTGLTSVNIPISVTAIVAYAFNGCSNLASVTIPSSVTSIGSSAFLGTAIYINESNWENNVLYISNHLIKAKSEISGEYTIKDGTLTIADNAFNDCSSLTSVTIPESVKAIGENAFQSCSGLKSATIPNSVTSIGSGAFMGCSALTSATIPSSITTINASAFSNCSSLESVTIPSSVTTIGWGAFSSCTGLTSVVIPNSVTSIEAYAFSGCTNLKEITSLATTPPNLGEDCFNGIASGCKLIVPNAAAVTDYKDATGWSAFSSNILSAGQIIYYTYSDGNVVTPYESGAFKNAEGKVVSFTNTYANGKGTLTFEGEVTTIGNNAFYNCTGLTSVTIPNSVTSIGEEAFYGCSSLTSVEIPNSVTSIGGGAFRGCSSLTSVVIPNSVTSIGEWAFYGCSSLTSVDIPNSVTSIGINAFQRCTGLTSVTIGESVTTIGDFAFFNCSALTSVVIPNSVTSIGMYAFHSCSSLTSVEIPNSVTTIGEWAFSGCTTLTSVTIGDNMTSIGNYAFSDCSGLTSVKIPNSVTSIGTSAFGGCSNLESVEIPNSVTSIGKDAFSGCSKLATITSYAVEPPTLGTDCFNNVTPSSIKVPKAAVSKYQSAAGWKDLTISALARSESVTISSAGLATLWLEYDATVPANAEVYYAKDYSDSKVKMTKITGNLPRETGVIVKGVADTYTFKEADTEGEKVTSMLVGSETAQTFEESGYKFYKLTYDTSGENLGFYLANNAGTIVSKPHKAYLRLPDASASAPARGIGIDWGEDDTTEIESVVDFNAESGTMYNLQGMPVGNDYKGIVIKNGRKMLNK